MFSEVALTLPLGEWVAFLPRALQRIHELELAEWGDGEERTTELLERFDHTISAEVRSFCDIFCALLMLRRLPDG